MTFQHRYPSTILRGLIRYFQSLNEMSHFTRTTETKQETNKSPTKVTWTSLSGRECTQWARNTRIPETKFVFILPQNIRQSVKTGTVALVFRNSSPVSYPITTLVSQKDNFWFLCYDHHLYVAQVARSESSKLHASSNMKNHGPIS